ncbi:MAG: ArsR/SmtB family transcription factor [Terriglobales bacterium]
MVTNANPVFRALADPTRRQILGLLRRQPQAVGEIAGHFRCSRPAVSKHLRLLRAAGLVRTEQRGRLHICRLDPAPLRLVGLWIGEYQAFWAASLRGLKTDVEGSR